MIRLPDPKQSVIARREEIVAALREIVRSDPRRGHISEGVISEPLRLKPYETDGLSAYRQVPLAVVLPETTEQVSSVTSTHGFARWRTRCAPRASTSSRSW